MRYGPPYKSAGVPAMLTRNPFTRTELPCRLHAISFDFFLFPLTSNQAMVTRTSNVPTRGTPPDPLFSGLSQPRVKLFFFSSAEFSELLVQKLVLKQVHKKRPVFRLSVCFSLDNSRHYQRILITTSVASRSSAGDQTSHLLLARTSSNEV